jgi:hypothetical protein
MQVSSVVDVICRNTVTMQRSCERMRPGTATATAAPSPPPAPPMQRPLRRTPESFDGAGECMFAPATQIVASHIAVRQAVRSRTVRDHARAAAAAAAKDTRTHARTHAQSRRDDPC